ncbi:DUF3000 domain-containing protein [Micromonospora chokoriensis]|uniref:DUF3000 domain-containing protein n=1 Tax=Micromonospora chokoriensis TaxID=356851 RepID=A0A1C4Z6K2_9ACTN|nr:MULTISPECIES: DUF3000 domain-containing protein [Micromonospora]MCZ7376081.1 DUF3000 domain-containing protein [Micromonospora sp. WMMC250]MDG4837491.1 DUF3000 domain-containing protein [Micromonospora sp. WMMD967]SCF28662.1 Protein of unknown function [Micromonospora chokoriensis]
MAPPIALPEAFARAVAGLRSATPRPEITLEEVGAPQRLAPYAFALAATVLRDGDEVATGRLILLHDPAGHEAWQGTLRLVTYVTAELEVDLAADPLLPGVGWTWLTDALDAQDAGHRAIGGTVTQTMSTRFGDLAGPPTVGDIEIRASWTPVDDDLTAHLLGWCALLADTAGLPPPGVTALSDRRPAGAA